MWRRRRAYEEVDPQGPPFVKWLRAAATQTGNAASTPDVGSHEQVPSLMHLHQHDAFRATSHTRTVLHFNSFLAICRRLVFKDPEKVVMVRITHLLSAEDVAAYLPSLCSLLQACVNPDPSTSSIGFLAPLSDADAEDYWITVGSKLVQAHHLFVLADPENALEVLATVQLGTVLKATHRHRGEITKLLVKPSVQRRGLGRLMTEHIESFAREELSLQLLTLDTETTTAARVFYNSTGWIEWGTCPAYAAFADGTLGSATFFRKTLR